MPALPAKAAAWLRRFLSPEDEPLRRKLYGAVVPALTLLVLAGVVTNAQADILGGLVGYLLLIPVTEWARSSVSPAPGLVGRHRARR